MDFAYIRGCWDYESGAKERTNEETAFTFAVKALGGAEAPFPGQSFSPLDRKTSGMPICDRPGMKIRYLNPFCNESVKIEGAPISAGFLN